MNQVLYHKAMALCDLPYEKKRLLNTSADGYLYKVINDESADWAINIDEDAFVSNIDALKGLIQYCIENGYVNCGMPDGGVVHLRDGNPLVTNPYFNILNTKAIRQIIDIAKLDERPDSTQFNQRELLVGNYNFENVDEEPYYPFLIWTSNHFKTLYLKATNHPDGESTVLCDHHGTPFLIHTWYSRFYNRDRFHTRRIDKAFSEACNGQGRLYKEPWGDMLMCAYERTKHELTAMGIRVKHLIIKK